MLSLMGSGRAFPFLVCICLPLSAIAIQHTARAMHEAGGQCSTMTGIGEGPSDIIVLQAAEGFVNNVPFAVIPFVPAAFDAIAKYGPPTALRNAALVDHAAYDAVSLYHPTALGIFAQEAMWTAHRKVCQGVCCDAEASKLFLVHQKLAVVYAFTFTAMNVAPQAQKDELRQTWTQILQSFGGLTAFDLMFDDSFDGCANMDTPWGVAKCVSLQVLKHAEHDGWNADGSLSRVFNRRPYQDFRYWDGDGHYYQPYSVQNYEGRLRGKIEWNPLQESTNGFFFRQEHVVPFIGFTARWYGYTPEDRCNLMKARKQNDPGYDYADELLFVLDETGALATNETKQMEVELFNDKFQLTLAQVQFAIMNGYSEFDFWKLIAASAFAIVNSASMVWRQKVISNLIRPTTIAQVYAYDKWGERTYTTYAGPGEGLRNIPISNWEPYIRTEPHAEYPSGSSCLCIAWKEVSEQLTNTTVIGGASFPFAAGSSKVAPGITPSANMTITYQTWKEMSDVCGRSRTDGGMHFSKSVQGGRDLCTGISDVLVNKFELLKGGSAAGQIADLNDHDIRICED